jgi:hypothetical protein
MPIRIPKEDVEDSDSESSPEEEETAPPEKSREAHPTRRAASREELVSQGIPIPDNYDDLPIDRIEEYAYELRNHLPSLCNHLGGHIRNHYQKKTGKVKYDWPFKGQDYDVLIHARYGGSILIRGNIGDREVIFCYGASQKYDIPCTINECLRGKDVDLAQKEAYTPWKCSRIGIMDCETYQSVAADSSSRNAKKRALTPEEKAKSIRKFLEGSKDGAWVSTVEQLKALLEVEELPEKFVSVLESLHDNDDPFYGDQNCAIM